MTTALLAGAPPAKDSAPNKTAGATAAAPDKAGWKAEIHTPEAEYNANVPLADIVPDPRNRKDHDQAELRSLADQIKAEGLLQPIVLRQQANGSYMIIAGERRWLAHKLLKRLTIAARIYKAETDLSAARKQAIENEGRKDLSPMARARNYQRLVELGDKQKELMVLFGKSQPVISNTLRLLELPGPVQDLVGSGKLSHAHGVALVRWARWKKVCLRIAECAIAHDYDAKSINDRGVPFCGTLEQEDLVQRIHIDHGHSWETRPTYTLPKALQEDPDFIRDGGDWIYMLPTDEKAPNKWAPEKERQDKARAAAEAKRQATNTKARETGNLTAEQKARKKKIADNKAAREKIASALDMVVQRLKSAKGIDGAALALIAKKARASSGDEAVEAAEMLGIKLPKGFDEWTEESWAKLAPADAVRLAAMQIAVAKAFESDRCAGAVPDEIEFLKGGKGK